ncbi:MAG: MFS transporter, partial [Chloroflexi bacterium]|nr:MFS transporter [Chloroflexota bacterium]
GWSRSALVGASSVGWIAASLAGPWIGRIIDRRGARLMLAISVIITGVSSVASGYVQEPWQFYISFGLLGGGARAALMNVAPGAMVANWFVRRRPLAFSFAALGPPASSLVFPPIAAAVVGAYGWRAGWMALGVFAVTIGLLPVLLLVRRRPEDMGLTPDGDPPAALAPARPAGSPPLPSPSDNDWTFQEALHSRDFWMVAASMALIQLAPGTVVLFLFSYFRDQGMSEAVAATTISVLSVVQVVSRMAFWTPVITRMGTVQRALLLWGGLLLASTLFLATAHTEIMAYLASAFIGLAMGGNLVLQLQIWPEYFGRSAVGAITGAAQMLGGLSAAGGPLLGAVLLDATGSYSNLYIAVAGFVLMGIALQVIVGKPRRPARPAVVPDVAGPVEARR